MNIESGDIMNMLLGIESLPSPHTADVILNLIKHVLQRFDFSLDSYKLYKAVTDNGSNIKKCLRDFHDSTEFEEIEPPWDAANVIPNLEPEAVEDYGELIEELTGPRKRTSCFDHTLCCELTVKVLYSV